MFHHKLVQPQLEILGLAAEQANCPDVSAGKDVLARSRERAGWLCAVGGVEIDGVVYDFKTKPSAFFVV